MVKESLVNFNKEWKELSHEVDEEGEWANIRYTRTVQNKERYGEESLEAGSRHRISLGLSGFLSKTPPKILFTGTGGKKSDLTTADWQKRLCRVLVNGKAQLFVLMMKV